MRLAQYLGSLASSKFPYEQFLLEEGILNCSNLEKQFEKEYLPKQIASLLYSETLGQAHGAIGIFGEFRLLQVEEALTMWRELNDEIGQCEAIVSDDRIKNRVAWRHLWFPFAWDADFNSFLVLDFEPTYSGSVGQVFHYPGSGPPEGVLASNFGQFLDRYLRLLEDSEYEVQEEQLVSIFSG